MKPKHKPCINCGANKYEPIKDGFKCEYCGTEYENEREITPFGSVEFSPYTTCFTGTVAMSYPDHTYNLRKRR